MSYENQIKNDYFEWLYDCVCKNRAHSIISYKKLFTLLHDIEFTFTIEHDLNRAMDGIDLRYRYSLEVDDDSIMRILEDTPCSVLEMIVALAIRCEETIMSNTEYGDRTGQWFWSMLNNLGIDYMHDERFNEKIAADVIFRFLNREYEPDGQGGLFYIRDCQDDLRDEEIWTQLCWYLLNFD